MAVYATQLLPRTDCAPISMFPKTEPLVEKNGSMSDLAIQTSFKLVSWFLLKASEIGHRSDHGQFKYFFNNRTMIRSRIISMIAFSAIFVNK